MRQLFLCHYSGDTQEVNQLAQELRLHGILPWVDKQGGFLIGDSAPESARKAIKDDCFGLLLYATPNVFDRPFIRKVEINEAIQVYERNKNFILIAIPRNLDFGVLSKKSIEAFGIDFSQFHTLNVNGSSELADRDLAPQFVEISRMVLRQQIIHHLTQQSNNKISFQFSTRELLPPGDSDVLLIDATSLFLDKAELSSQFNWGRVSNGLLDIKAALAEICGRPRIQIHGSKHLTSAYLLGRIFSRPSGFNLEIRQRETYWCTDYSPNGQNPLIVNEIDGSAMSNQLFVEISITGKDVSESVRNFIRTTGQMPHRFVKFSLQEEYKVVDNSLGVSIALQIRETLAKMIGHYPISEIHIFSAVPQGLAVLIGHNLSALPPVQLYEFDGYNYIPSYKILDT
jgi:hypothetical protein